MKKIICTSLIISFCFSGFAQDSTIHKFTDTLMLENIEVVSIRASANSPFTKTDISKLQIAKANLGQDLPFLLNQTPAVVVNSDAGNGIGYTGIRIRGSDASRVNVTLNGIPYNDAESQGTFFVDLPDIASSMNSIQVQRGVGTSSNGAAAFGATINLSTNELNKERYTELNNSFGSFNTWKNTIKIGTGLFKKHFTLDARVSGISSDGFIDRARSNLQSFYVSAAYVNNNSSLRFNILNGREKTYQAWYGVPESYLDSNRTYNPAGTEKPGSPYKNETDNYTQTHYQLFYNRKVNDHIKFNTAFFLTRGKGYYEEYRADQYYSEYGLSNYLSGVDTIVSTDLVRRLWLDNYFYGTVFSASQQKNKTQLTFGGGWSNYEGKHYNIVTWAQYGFPGNYKYVDLPANKNDLNFYAKLLQSLGSGFSMFLDLQGRFVNYHISGFESHPDLDLKKHYDFFNPKAGISYSRNKLEVYLSWSVASKEPNRDDFEAGINQQPTAEKLNDFELGVEKKAAGFSYGMTLYYMNYKDQLVTSGKINDVGAYTRTNTPNSYRMGAEFQAALKISSWINASGNISFSKNRIKTFSEYIDDYDNGGQLVNQFKNTTISFSPDVVSASAVNFIPFENTEINIQSKYVSRQFLDNTSNTDRSVNPYFVHDVRLAYTLHEKYFKKVDFIFIVNNILNKKYEANGYTYNYFTAGKLTVENYYFPMAGTNFLAAINIQL